MGRQAASRRQGNSASLFGTRITDGPGDIRRDILHAQGLIEDAVSQLIGNFTAIDEFARSLRKHYVGAAATADGTAILVDRIVLEAGAAVINLQFQDMVSQILAHALQKLDALEHALSPECADETDSPGTQAPVKTTIMRAGDIDLF